MFKESTYQQKFHKINAWLPRLITEIKKELKSGHLKNNLGFVRDHFPTKNLNKIGVEELVQVYGRLVMEGNEALGEYLATRWLLKHGDLYGYFERELGKITPDFTDLKELDVEVSKSIMEGAVREYGAINTYLFSVLNSVVFPAEIYNQLEVLARQQESEEEVISTHQLDIRSMDALREEHERVLARVVDRYEKKLSGLERKYLQDVGLLQNQLASLQRKLAAKG